jgi:CBS domain-containing protein
MTSAKRYVIDIMTHHPVVVGPGVAAWSADHLAEERGVHHLLVIDGYRLVGVVCGCDLHRAGVSVEVGACMHRHPATIDDQETADAAAHRMIALGVGCLPVVDWSETLRGVVTRHDLRGAGLLPANDVRRCASCGSTHGLDASGEVTPVSFCFQCSEQARQPQSVADETYFTLGGGG